MIDSRLRGRRRPLPIDQLESKVPQYRLMVDALVTGLSSSLSVRLANQARDTAVRPLLPLKTPALPNPWYQELRFGGWLAVAPGAAHDCKRAPLSVLINILQQLATNLDPETAKVGGVAPGTGDSWGSQ